jgi:hypothetical protein
MRQEEFFLGREKRFRRDHDWTKGRQHLKANQDEDHAPDLKMAVRATAKPTRMIAVVERALRLSGSFSF